MISLQSANKYSVCLSCGSDKDVHAVLIKRNSGIPHEITLCKSCLLALVGQIQYIDTTSEGTNSSDNCSQKA